MARGVFAYHWLLVIVSAISGERAFVVARSIELGPPFVAEVLHARKVSPEAGGFLTVSVGKLTLMTRYRNTIAIWKQRACFAQLPHRCRCATRHSAEIFWVLPECPHAAAAPAVVVVDRSNASQREMHEGVARSGTPPLSETLVGYAPRVSSVAAGGRTLLV